MRKSSHCNRPPARPDVEYADARAIQRADATLRAVLQRGVK